MGSSRYRADIKAVQGLSIQGRVKDLIDPGRSVEVALVSDGAVKDRQWSESDGKFNFVVNNALLLSSKQMPLQVFVIEENLPSVAVGRPFAMEDDFSHGPYGEVTASGKSICGWARDGKSPGTTLEVELVCNGTRLALRPCDRFMQPLQALGFEHGCYGFEFELTQTVLDQHDGLLEVRVVGGDLLRRGRLDVAGLKARLIGEGARTVSSEHTMFFNEGTVELRKHGSLI